MERDLKQIGQPAVNRRTTENEIPAHTPEFLV